MSGGVTKLKLDIDPDIVAMMAAEVAAGERAVTAAMREAGHVTTTEARLFLEVMNPSQRVTELRNQGAEIDTAWTLEPSEAGRDPHRQARYVLTPNQGGAALFDAVAWVAFGAWLATVALWLVEVLL